MKGKWVLAVSLLAVSACAQPFRSQGVKVMTQTESTQNYTVAPVKTETTYIPSETSTQRAEPDYSVPTKTDFKLPILIAAAAGVVLVGAMVYRRSTTYGYY